ncbi:hypothetical protein Misp01_65720 [Microtetraspora sp. NBRC 13810]|uniref:hypothetical protein n=1 Tax=Microtetraspora sp. NBRC 13810 TaxID=3030990 RepID=UPI0024A3843F|nr:hypothetical protein [Microtetraspora sp. NBRC 13810]GLW11444.1 hypothetical protein Misp01_65720 [Microtetraspora sp. NBRC 13810]
MTTILTIGLHPGAIDYTGFPGLDEATLTARIEQGHAALRAAGFDAVSCLVGTDPDEAERTVREQLAQGPFGVVMIGGGVRMSPEHTLLFERLINVLVATTPGIRFCFNTSPETTIDAIRRWI